MIERPEMIERLRAVLSAEPRSTADLLTRAGLQVSRKTGVLASVAIRELHTQGVARRHGVSPHLTWSLAEASDEARERVELPGLDAACLLATRASRTFGGTQRTELTAVVELGPSWPAATSPPPRWSTGLSDAQVASGGLVGARLNAIARAEAQLRALRTHTALPTLPTETTMTDASNPLIAPSKDRQDFLAYLASVDRGARQDSACAWMAKRGLARTTDEARRWLDQLVVEGLVEEHERTAADGSLVVRYLPAIPTTPAPLPKSSAVEPAPAPAPSVSPLASEPEPTAPSNDAAAPSEPPPAVDAAARAEAWQRECESLGREREGLRHQLWEAESKITTLGEKVQDWERRYLEADRAAARDLAELKAEAEIYYEALCRIAPDLRGTSAGHLADGACEEVARLRQKARPPHQGEQFATSIAGWLVSLSEEAWQQVQQARTDLAKARDLREQSHQLEQSALDALDRLVGAPAAPQAAPVAPQAPELVPDPIPLGPAPAAPPPLAKGSSEDGPVHPLQRAVLALVLEGHAKARPIAEQLKEDQHRVSSALSALSLAGWIVRTAPGHYAPGRRAA